MPVSPVKSTKSTNKPLTKVLSIPQQLGTLHQLALDLAVKKLAWALEHIDEASSDPLVKLALSKGLDTKPLEETSQDSRVEIVLSAPDAEAQPAPELP